MKKILILGGTRYFGKQLVHLLLEDGHEVTIATRGLTPDPFGNRVNRISLDRNNENSFREGIGNREWDLIFDQSCYSSLDADNAVRILSNRTGKYVYTSTQSVYLKDGRVVEEDFLPLEHPAIISKASEASYGENKRRAEAVFFQKAPFKITAVRFPIVLGVDDYTGRLEFHLRRIREGRPFVIPNIEAKVSLIHSRDASKFLHWISGKDFQGPVNACSPHSHPMRELVLWMENLYGKKALITTTGSEADETPFTGEISRYMSAEKPLGMGFPFEDTSQWLPEVMAKLKDK